MRTIALSIFKESSKYIFQPSNFNINPLTFFIEPLTYFCKDKEYESNIFVKQKQAIECFIEFKIFQTEILQPFQSFLSHVTYLSIILHSFLNTLLKVECVMKMKKILLLAFLIPFYGLSQNASIRGFIYEKETGEPVIFTNVYLQGTNFGASTDVNGYFTISQIPPGEYNLMVTYLGFDSIKEPVSLKSGQILNKRLYLEKSAIQLDVFEVSAERQEGLTETKTSIIKITPKQINSIPSVGTPDLAQYLQVLPGIIFTGDQGGQLYVRGGPPIQNKILLDGLVIYNPFHSIGLFSVFETDIMRNVDIYTGGFGAEYGGRISSIMDITTRDGNKSRLSGAVGASTFGSRVILEGPIKKLNPETGTSASFIFAGKNSYLRESSKIFYNYIDTAGLPFNFLDLYGKVSLNTESGSKLNVFGFNFADSVIYKDVATFNWRNTGMGANFILVPGQTTSLIEGNLGYSDYMITLDDFTGFPKSSHISGFNLGLRFSYFLQGHEVKYGIETQGFKTDFRFVNAAGRNIVQEQNTTEIAFYIKDKISTKKLILEPSFRLHFYASMSDVSPEPRFAFKYIITDKIRIKGAGGLYSQNLIAANSDRDVVNLFYGFLSGPENLQQTFDGEEITHRLQKAQHAIFGIEVEPIKRLIINIEGYYKYFSQLTNLNRNKVFDDSFEYWDKPDYLKKDFIVERGNAYGGDISVKYEQKKFYIWAVYSLGYINRDDGILEYVPHYDRRHNANIVGTAVLGGKQNSEISVRWNFGSGFPFTRNQGHYPLITFEDGLDTDITSANDQLGTIFSDINDGRLPYYHRLDLSFKHTYYFTETVKLELILGVTNVYNRANIFYFDRITKERIDQLPIMPSFGMTLKF